MKITCLSPTGLRTATDIARLLDSEARETARRETLAWIKRLRLVRYGAEPMRTRFTYKGDSLWWFTEIYLHKMRRLEAAVETVLALSAAVDAGAAGLVVETKDYARREAALAFGRARQVPVAIADSAPAPRGHRWPGALVGVTGRLSRLRPAGRPPAASPTVAAFVHTAFWRTQAPQEEAYIGPILDALVARLTKDRVCFVGLGPRRNFRARRWWDPMTPTTEPDAPVVAIERLAPAASLRPSTQLWRNRRQLADALLSGPDIRAAGEVRGCDLWPVLRHELEGAALVQWPWSARSMDEAGAAIDALQPGVVVTYAEAGGWGRALVLAARRRRVPSVGIQHGFIYRHWLNYLHETDEMAPAGDDAGFPRPDRTLLYDDYAADHLARAGHLPASGLMVTGSARLEALAQKLAALRDRRETIRARLGAAPQMGLALLTSKASEIRDELPALVGAVSGIDTLRLVIKPHPAETPKVYDALAEGRPAIAVAPADADLAELMTAADLIVTMNSTVAIDALVLGIPSLVVGLPNNLSPFVEAGVMLGANGADAIARGLRSVLYDRQIRQSLADRARDFVARHRLAPAPGAASRAADAILGALRQE